jgi:hypothetical protein
VISGLEDKAVADRGPEQDDRQDERPPPLEPDAHILIKTVRGAGYIFVPTVSRQ